MLTLIHFINSMRWAVPAAAILAPSPLLFVLLQVLRVFKPILPAEFFERCDETIWSTYQRIVLTFFANMNGTQLIISGDYESFMNSKENAVVMSNHQTAVDWIVMDFLAVQQNALGKMRFMLKDELKYIPLFGLYFWQHNCVNVGRFGGFNETKTVQQLRNLKELKIPIFFVVFPEGTRFNPNKQDTIVKSKKFAEKNGLPVLEHLLTPRSHGTYLVFAHVQSHVQVLYDLTFAYESSRVLSDDGKSWIRASSPGMVEFVMSYSPKLHVNIRRIEVKDIPREEQQLSAWMHDLFVHKDRLLKKFYETGQLTEQQTVDRPVTRWCETLPYACFYLALTATCLMYPKGRAFYMYTSVVGSLAGFLWMKFH